MKLPEGQKGIIYTIKSINGDEEINKFLFTLGCFEGETISIVKKMYSNLIINIKGGRYGIDKDLAEDVYKRQVFPRHVAQAKGIFIT